MHVQGSGFDGTDSELIIGDQNFTLLGLKLFFCRSETAFEELPTVSWSFLQ